MNDWLSFNDSGRCNDCGKHTPTMFEVEGYTGARILFCEDCFGEGDNEDDLADVPPIH